MNLRRRDSTITLFAISDGIVVAILASRRRFRTPLPATHRRVLRRAYAALNLLNPGGMVTCFRPGCNRQQRGPYDERVAALMADLNLNDVDLVIDATLTLPRVHPIVRLTAVGMADVWTRWGTWPTDLERALPEGVRQNEGVLAGVRRFILGDGVSRNR